MGVGFHTDASVADVEIGNHQRKGRPQSKTKFYYIAPAEGEGRAPGSIRLLVGPLNVIAIGPAGSNNAWCGTVGASHIALIPNFSPTMRVGVIGRLEAEAKSPGRARPGTKKENSSHEIPTPQNRPDHGR